MLKKFLSKIHQVLSSWNQGRLKFRHFKLFTNNKEKPNERASGLFLEKSPQSIFTPQVGPSATGWGGRRRRILTIRSMFPAVLILAGIMGASLATTVEKSYVRLEATEMTVEAGKVFSIGVYAYAHVPVNTVDIAIRFDEKAVEVMGIDKGQSVITLWTEEPLVRSNKVILRGGTFKKGFLGEHLIATVNFKAKETGVSSFSASDVVLLAGDGSGARVSTTQAAGSKVELFIYDENTDPGQIGITANMEILTDIDGDGKVTIKDLSSFMGAWSAKDKILDFDGDNKMTFKDFSIILADFVLK